MQPGQLCLPQVHFSVFTLFVLSIKTSFSLLSLQTQENSSQKNKKEEKTSVEFKKPKASEQVLNLIYIAQTNTHHYGFLHHLGFKILLTLVLFDYITIIITRAESANVMMKKGSHNHMRDFDRACFCVWDQVFVDGEVQAETCTREK